MLLTQFINLYHQLYLATTQLNTIVINTICKDSINSWKNQAKNELGKSSIQILLSLFEDYDTEYRNQIKSTNIDNIISRFYGKFNLPYGDSNHYQEEYYNFHDLLYIIMDLPNLPPMVSTIIDDFINNRISICVHCNKLMTLENVTDCYHENQGEAICDFSLTKVSNQVFHCNSNKSIHHPYGFDVDIKHSKPYFQDLLYRRLENRLFNQLQLNKCYPINTKNTTYITTRYQEIIQKIVPNTIIYYNGLRMDLSNRWSIGTKAVSLLRNKLENYKRIIKMEQNWNEIITTQINQLDIIIKDTILLHLSLDIEKNIFNTKEEKTQNIKNYRQTFYGYATNMKKNLENSNQLNSLLLDLEINTTIINDNILDSYYQQVDEAINNFYIAIETLELSTPLDSLISISKVQHFNLDNCSICLENDNQPEISKIDKCGHCFHTNCVLRWLIENNSCPICRSN